MGLLCSPHWHRAPLTSLLLNSGHFSVLVLSVPQRPLLLGSWDLLLGWGVRHM